MILREWHQSPDVTPNEIREALRTATLHTFLPGHEIQWLASQWRVMLLQEHTTSLDDNFDTALRAYLDGFTAQWLLQDSIQPTVHILDPDAVFAHWRTQEPSSRPVPRPLGFAQVVVAHLFSGRRRPGDFQSFAEAAILPGGLTCSALSVDIIFSVQWGNLLRKETLELFLRAVHCGVIICILAGPPCESWSIARLRGGVLDDGPRPVRSAEELSGFGHLRMSELRQVCTGNELLGVSLRLAVGPLAGRVAFHFGAPHGA